MERSIVVIGLNASSPSAMEALMFQGTLRT